MRVELEEKAGCRGTAVEEQIKEIKSAAENRLILRKNLG